MKFSAQNAMNGYLLGYNAPNLIRTNDTERIKNTALLKEKVEDPGTSMYGTDAAGNLLLNLTANNSKLGALAFWNYLSKKYFGQNITSMIRDNTYHLIWSLFDDELLAIDERIMLGSTLDGAILRKKDTIHYMMAIHQLTQRAVVGNLEQQGNIIKQLFDHGAEVIAWDHNKTFKSFWDGNTENYFYFMDDPILQEHLKKLSI